MRLAARLTGWKIDIRGVGGEGTPEVEPKSAFEETKAEIAGDDDEAKDEGEKNLDPVSQDRDVADEKVEEQQEETSEDKEKDAE